MWDLEQDKSLRLDFRRPKFFMTSSVALRETGKIESTTFEVFLNFKEYPKPPTISYPEKLEERIGPPSQLHRLVKVLDDWDIVHPPNWTDLIRELEGMIYKTDTHLVEPIIEEGPIEGKGKKKKGGADYPQKDKPKK